MIRTSNNDVLYECGVSRAKGNNLQRIEKVVPGSIEFSTVLGLASSVLAIADYSSKLFRVIRQKIKAEREQDLRGSGKDKKVYYKYPVTIDNEEQNKIYVENVNEIIVNIHICNGGDEN